MALHLQPLHSTDRNLFDRALAAMRPVRECALAMLAWPPHAVWVHDLSYSWGEVEGWWCLFASYADGLYMPLPPLGPITNHGRTNDPMDSYESVLRTVFAYLGERNEGKAVSRIENIPEELKPEFEQLGCGLYEKDSEYVYDRAELVALRGDRFKSQRGAYNHFVRLHRPAYRPYFLSDRDDCLRLYDRWMDQKQRGLSKGQQEEEPWLEQAMMADARSAHREALTHHDDLGLIGRVVVVEDRVCAYTFGYPRTAHVFCVMLEVADRTMSGLAQYIFREFSRECSQYPLINTMDDAGLKKLGKSKQGYHPNQRIPNYTASCP